MYWFKASEYARPDKLPLIRPVGLQLASPELPGSVPRGSLGLLCKLQGGEMKIEKNKTHNHAYLFGLRLMSLA